MIAYMTWRTGDTTNLFDKWVNESFKKVIVTANIEQIKAIDRNLEHTHIITESSLDNRIVCAVVHPIYSDNISKNLPLIK